MEGSSKAKARRRRTTATGAYSGKTKLDRWLEEQIPKGTDLSVVIQPPAPYKYPSNDSNDCSFRVRVIQVDRYAVMLEFQDHVSEDDGAVWWVSKDSIRAVGQYVAQEDEDFDEDDF